MCQRAPFDEREDPAAGARCLGWVMIYTAVILSALLAVVAWL